SNMNARELIRRTPLERPAVALVRRLRRLVGCPPPMVVEEPTDPGPPMFRPPGHYYSPVPSTADIAAFRERSAAAPPEIVPGIDLPVDAQAALLEAFGPLYEEQPFPARRGEETRYWFENHSFSYGDALALYCMLRHIAPKRIVEVGSGWSSCVILDTAERH